MSNDQSSMCYLIRRARHHNLGYRFKQLRHTGEIVLNTEGTYFIIYSATGKIDKECEYTYDNWSIGIYLDGILQAGSVKAASTRHNDFETITGHVIVAVKPGQIVTLRNVSDSPLHILGDVSGSSTPNTSAAVDLFLLTSGTTF